MELWIRNQNKRTLLKANRIDVDGKNIIVWDNDYYCSETYMGTYATEERALEVLDEINSCIQTNAGFDIYSKLGGFANGYNEKYSLVPVYQMPEV